MKRYDNIFFSAPNLELGRQFYEQVLGLKVKFDFQDRGIVGF